MFKLFTTPQFRPRHYAGGVAVILLLIALYFAALRAVFSAGESYSWQQLWQDGYLRHLIWFSFWQAALSAFLSVLLGVIFARALFYQSFYGKALLLKIFSLTFVLPVLVAVFGLIGIYGSSGWLAKLSAWFNLDWHPNIYGLSGILIAHLFFNIPLAARFFLQSLQAIPPQQHQLAAQLNIRGWQFIRLIELSYLRQQILSVFALIFMLCFTSFTIVLTLGGGPKYTTLEVAIYQAVIFDFDLSKAALFALLQFVLCFVLFALSHLFGKPAETPVHSRRIWLAEQKSAVRIWQVFVIIVFSLFILLPLINIVVSALLSDALFSLWQSPQLWRAMAYSFSIAPLSALLSLLMSTAVLLLTRRLHWLYHLHLASALINLSMIILAVPTLILAIGLFLLLQQTDFHRVHLFIIVLCCNALAAMPFVLRILAYPMNNNMIYYEKLCQSLGISGWRRFRFIEWHQLAQPLKYAFALACALSLGDFTAIALFGNQQFTSLPHLLYQQLGSYRGEQAAVTALILLSVCLMLFWLAERNKRTQDDQIE